MTLFVFYLILVPHNPFLIDILFLFHLQISWFSNVKDNILYKLNILFRFFSFFSSFLYNFFLFPSLLFQQWSHLSNDIFTSCFYFIYVSCMRLLFVRFDSNIFIFFLLVYSLCLRIFILLNKDAFATYTFLKSWIACWRRRVEDIIFSCFLYFYSDIEEKYNNKINPPRSILRIEFFAGKSNLNIL